MNAMKMSYKPYSIPALKIELYHYMTARAINQMIKDFRGHRKWYDKFNENKYVAKRMRAVLLTYKRNAKQTKLPQVPKRNLVNSTT